MLATAAEHLCVEATTLDADRLTILARQLRHEIDEAGIAVREQARHTARSLRWVRQADGMTRPVGVMDPESAATITDLCDRATSPKRGGARFVGGNDATLAERRASDNRSTEQLASETFTELPRHGATTDSTRLLGSGAPAVRVHVTAERRTGTAALHHTTPHRPGCPCRAACGRTGCCGVAAVAAPAAPAAHRAQAGEVTRLGDRVFRDALATPHRRDDSLPTPPPTPPQHRLGNPARRHRLLADPTTQHRPPAHTNTDAHTQPRTHRTPRQASGVASDDVSGGERWLSLSRRHRRRRRRR